MRRISVRRRLLCTLWRHLGRRRLAGNTARSQQLLLDIILALAGFAIIELAWWTKDQHYGSLSVLTCGWLAKLAD
jgi:hypothetical protein